ncbi:phosphotransferase [Mucilaginibacter sp. PAMB04274]|uniref:phosphotransferase enzyme family protein n=1 Tax=Mucilaginibacter sp. PAMB04274 TaxID=3138568 RepID=UPI0031F65294
MYLGSYTFNTLKDIVSQFNIQGEVKEINAYGSGHINDTFHIINAKSELPDYLLQRINSHVFENVAILINNIEIVTHHIKQKLSAWDGVDPNQQVLTLVRTSENKCYYQDNAGNYWRVYIFLKNTLSFDIVTTINQAREGGKAFGRFQALISDLNADLLGETIPDFHNIEKRLQKFKYVLDADPVGRSAYVAEETAFVLKRQEEMCSILNLGRAGKLPLRITHNDTKFNNVLLDADGKAQCVIDLDTVMPGYIAYDFGDAIRSIVNTAAEDEADTSKIDVNISLFKAFAIGFLKETANVLTDLEIKSLTIGTLLLPYMIGLRFLTDYLEGDIYFKTQSSDHNLQRARAQFQLLRKLEDNYEDLQRIVQTTTDEYRLTVPINNHL